MSLADSSGQTRRLNSTVETMSGWFPLVLLMCAACLLYDAGAFADPVTVTPIPFRDGRTPERKRQELTNLVDEVKPETLSENAMSRFSQGGIAGTRLKPASTRRPQTTATSAQNKNKKPSIIPYEDKKPSITQNKKPKRIGRGKKKKDMMRLIMAIKMILVSILVPKVIGLALFASWKGITISLIAFTIAAIAIKSSASCVVLQSINLAGTLISGLMVPTAQESKKSIQLLIKKQDHSGENHHHEHWWRKIREAEPVYYEEQPHHQDPYHGWTDD